MTAHFRKYLNAAWVAVSCRGTLVQIVAAVAMFTGAQQHLHSEETLPRSVLSPTHDVRERDSVVVLEDDASHRVVYVDAYDDRTGPSFSHSTGEPYQLQLLPDGLMYRSYLAGPHEPRMAGIWHHERDMGWVWDITLGGRIGMLRYGTDNPVRPEGWQLDVEGAVFPRLDLEEQRDMISADFRFGVPLTYRKGPIEAKFGYYHLSSHLGDEYQVTHPEATRINFSRDALLLGGAYYPTESLRLYGEVGWAYYTAGGSRPWEFQFGGEYSPTVPSVCSPCLLGAMPFAAANVHLREEVDFSGDLTLQTGLQWRGRASDNLFRVGVEYFNGMSRQFQFFSEHEEQLGFGIWYDY